MITMNVSQIAEFVLFADDANMLISDSGLYSVIVNNELSNLSLRSQVNRLSLNVTKLT